MNEFVTDGHLGGYVRGGDEATYYPDLWRWLVREQGVMRVLDIGCGEGHALKVFEQALVERAREDENHSDWIGHARGIDGIPQDDWRIYQHDFTKGPFTEADIPPTSVIGPVGWDLIWCCEFVEHVEEQYVPNFIETFKLGRLVLMTHAMPGQQGYHHVNCQGPNYWVEVMRAEGFRLDVEMTIRTRDKAALNTSPWNHYLRSGMAFINDGYTGLTFLREGRAPS